MNKFLFFLCFLYIPWVARGQSTFDWLYWFDSDVGNKRVGTSSVHPFMLQAETHGLDEGFHSIHVQVADSKGRFSPPQTQLFYHAESRAPKILYYWFDGDTEVHRSSLSGEMLSMDVSALASGLHYVYCRVEDEAGRMSDVVARPFYRQVGDGVLLWTYWFDDNVETKVTVPCPNVAVMIDVSGLSDGFHTIHSQINGETASAVVSSMFIKMPQTDGLSGNMTCLCMVGDQLVAKDKVPVLGGVLNWDVDVRLLDAGQHTASFWVVTRQGVASNVVEHSFERVFTSAELRDVNSDGTVNISDVTALLNLILGKDSSTEGWGDVNGDGSVNISDVTALVNIILGK